MNKLLLFGSIAVLASGCSPKHLAYVSETTIGIDVAVSAEGSTGRIVFGYDRDNFALVPKTADGKDAMSLTALSCIYAQGIREISFNHFVASGKAAQFLAEDEKALKTINVAMFGGGTAKCEQ